MFILNLKLNRRKPNVLLRSKVFVLSAARNRTCGLCVISAGLTNYAIKTLSFKFKFEFQLEYCSVRLQNQDKPNRDNRLKF